MRAVVLTLCAVLVSSAAHVDARLGSGVDASLTRRAEDPVPSPTALQPVPLVSGRPAWTHAGDGVYRLRIPIRNAGDRPVTTVHVSLPGLSSRVLAANWFSLPTPLPGDAATRLEVPVAPGADPFAIDASKLRVKGFAGTGAQQASKARCDQRRWPSAAAPWPSACDLRPLAWPAPTVGAVLAL